jgi:hypothetical protein
MTAVEKAFSFIFMSILLLDIHLTHVQRSEVQL